MLMCTTMELAIVFRWESSTGSDDEPILNSFLSDSCDVLTRLLVWLLRFLLPLLLGVDFLSLHLGRFAIPTQSK